MFFGPRSLALECLDSLNESKNYNHLESPIKSRSRVSLVA